MAAYHFAVYMFAMQNLQQHFLVIGSRTAEDGAADTAMYSIPKDTYFSGDGTKKTGGKQLKSKRRAPSRKRLENEAKAAADA